MRGLDTAYNYQRFTSHRALSRVAGDLLGQFVLSTKVGFFANGDPAGCTQHSLDAARLREAVERSTENLGRTPDFVFLHSPERTLAGLPTSEGRRQLAAACNALAETVTAGLCGAWGIASWDPRSVVKVIDEDVPGIQPRALLLRAGLSVANPILSAGEQMCRVLGVAPDRRWGMSPFGGSTSNRAWHAANLGAFLQPEQSCSALQAAFRLAYELPPVVRVAVGTSNPAHLGELVAATELVVNDNTIGWYRQLIQTPVDTATEP